MRDEQSDIKTDKFSGIKVILQKCKSKNRGSGENVQFFSLSMIKIIFSSITGYVLIIYSKAILNAKSSVRPAPAAPSAQGERSRGAR